MTYHRDLMGHRARNGAGERAGEGRGAEEQRGKAVWSLDQECVLPLALQHPDSWKAGPDALLLPLRVRQPPLAGPGGSLAFPIRSLPSSRTMRSPPTTAPLLTVAPPPTAPQQKAPSPLWGHTHRAELWGSQRSFCSRSGVERLGYTCPGTCHPPSPACARAHMHTQEVKHFCYPMSSGGPPHHQPSLLSTPRRALQWLTLGFRTVQLSTRRHAVTSSNLPAAKAPIISGGI